MEHISTVISFIDKHGDSIKVVYKHYPEPPAEVFVNDISVYEFTSLPYTNTKNPTKTQAKELIAFVKKNKK